MIPPLGRLLIDLFGLRPQMVLTALWIWQPVTYLFLHGDFFHILFNMLVLWMFGVQLERLWGSPFFLRYYFITGIGAGVATIVAGLLPFAFSEPTYLAVTIGASGAIYGLLDGVRDLLPEHADPDVPPLPGAGEVLRDDHRGHRVPVGATQRRGRTHRSPRWARGRLCLSEIRSGGGGLTRLGRFGVMAEIKYQVSTLEDGPAAPEVQRPSRGPRRLERAGALASALRRQEAGD